MATVKTMGNPKRSYLYKHLGNKVSMSHQRRQSKFLTDLTSSSRDTTLLQQPIKTRTTANVAPMVLTAGETRWERCHLLKRKDEWSIFAQQQRFVYPISSASTQTLRFQLTTSQSEISLFLVPGATWELQFVRKKKNKTRSGSQYALMFIHHEVKTLIVKTTLAINISEICNKITNKWAFSVISAL